MYGVDESRMAEMALATRVPGTCRLPSTFDVAEIVPFHDETTPRIGTSDITVLLPQSRSPWSELPPEDLKTATRRTFNYGLIGAEDRTMSPLIRPGAVVQIDQRQRRWKADGWYNEYERPIYFIELHGGYACGWIEIRGSVLMLVPHTLSKVSIRQFRYPSEAEILGRVTGIATRLSPS